MDADEHLSLPDLGNGDGFEANIIHTAVDRCLHGRRNRARLNLDRVLSGHGHESILDDMEGDFVSNQWDGWTDSNEALKGVRWRTFDDWEDFNALRGTPPGTAGRTPAGRRRYSVL
jgi:hypothetical protein